MDISAYKVLTFDCYGTLIDWESGILAALSAWRRRAGVAVEDSALLEAFGRHEAAAQAAHPEMLYPDILARVATGIGDDLNAPMTPADGEAFGWSLADWPPFPDSAPALQYLKQHFELVILSNVDRKSFSASNRRLGVVFDAIYTAQDIGSYKPDPRNFTYMIDQLADRGAGLGDILHVAESLYHDHVPAKAAGLATAWIHRRHDKTGHGATSTPDDEVAPDMQFESLAGFAEAHRREQSEGSDNQAQGS